MISSYLQECFNEIYNKSKFFEQLEEASNSGRLYERNFNADDWLKIDVVNKEHDNYAARVIQSLLDNQDVPLGQSSKLTNKNGTAKKSLQLKDFDDSKLRAILRKISKSGVNVDVEEFNAAYTGPNPRNKNIWNNIDKATYSGTTGGHGKNKGNIYEDTLAENFKDYIAAGCDLSLLKTDKYSDVKKVCDAIGYYKFSSSEHAGTLNQRRHPHFTDKGITFDSNDIGAIVTDITLNTVDGPFYLSVKYGPKVTFINAGTQKVITCSEMKEGHISNVNGRALLEMIGVDPDKFVKYYSTYGSKTKTSAETDDVTLELKKSKVFNDFITSVIGYNYVLVHKDVSGELTIKVINTEDDIKAMLGKMISATVVYPSSSRKRVDVFVTFQHIQLQLNVRSKTGSLYPTHIMSDYKFIE